MHAVLAVVRNSRPQGCCTTAVRCQGWLLSKLGRGVCNLVMCAGRYAPDVVDEPPVVCVEEGTGLSMHCVLVSLGA